MASRSWLLMYCLLLEPLPERVHQTSPRNWPFLKGRIHCWPLPFICPDGASVWLAHGIHVEFLFRDRTSMNIVAAIWATDKNINFREIPNELKVSKEQKNVFGWLTIILLVISKSIREKAPSVGPWNKLKAIFEGRISLWRSLSIPAGGPDSAHSAWLQNKMHLASLYFLPFKSNSIRKWGQELK